MNDPIKNLSGQDIENLIELYSLERIALFVGQLRCWLSSLDADPQITAMYDNVFVAMVWKKFLDYEATAEKGQESFRFIRWQCKRMAISEVPIFSLIRDSAVPRKTVDNLAKPEETQV